MLIRLFLLVVFLQVEGVKIYTEDELLGKINPALHSDFSLVPSEFCSRSGIYLRSEVLDKFLILRQLAEDEGIELIVVSGTRSFNHQKDIWDRKWAKSRYMGWDKIEKARDILTYSSMPGTSRHHWGTDFDLNSLENSYFDSGEGKKVYDFMERCGGEHGFKQVYTSKDSGRTGCEEEKWHWSYMPVSSTMLNQYNELVCIKDIRGFDGSEVADSINVIGVFVNGIAE